MKIHLLSIAFAPARILNTHLFQVYDTIGVEHDGHHIHNNHYPLNEDYITDVLYNLCAQHSMKLYDTGKNIGSAAAWNHLFVMCRPAKEDIVVLLDPDTNPITPGWGKAIKDVFAADKKVAWVSLTFPQVDKEFSERPHKEYEVAGHRVLQPTETMINSICAFRAGVVREIGGFEDGTPWYGGFEAKMWAKINPKYKWLFLKDFKEAYDPRFESDPEYKEYKIALAHKRSTKDDFKTWLSKR
jgi:hypothetical protein